MTRRNTFLPLIAVIIAVSLPSLAETGRKPQQYIRDAEIENNLKAFAAPIFQQNGLSPESVRFVLVNDRAVNAFVAGGANMFFTTGLLRETRNANELMGVIAHESGHIAGGHLIRLKDEMENASIAAMVSTLFGVAAAVGSGNASAGGAAVSLGNQVAQRSMLAYSRTQESAADQSALQALAKADIPADGMMHFLQRLQDQELLPEDQQIEFVRTHPMTRDRVEAVAAYVREHPNTKPLPPEYDKMFRRMQAKLLGYIDPRGTLQKIGPNPTTFESRYGAAIARHQTGDTTGALALTELLLKAEPDNPYLHELKGQILYETGQAKLSVAEYQKAVTLLPDSALLRVGLGQALLATNDTLMLGEAVSHLEAASDIERKSSMTWRLLATAYGKQNNMGLAAYALAESAAADGEKGEAKAQAKRAQDLLPKNSPGWLKASDLLNNLDLKDKDD